MLTQKVIGMREFNFYGLEDKDRYIKDRKDIWRYTEYLSKPAIMSVSFLYDLVEINCNPDFDW